MEACPLLYKEPSSSTVSSQNNMVYVGVTDRRTRGDATDKNDISVEATKINSYSSSDEESQLNESGPNPFIDPKIAQHYRELYDKTQYECRGAFDPDFEWTKEEEKKIIRKIDYRVAFTACVMFVGLQVDRGNLAQAVADNLLDDLGLTTDQYNHGNTIFLVAFLLAELPSQIISKRLGPDIFVPLQMTLWSIVATSQGAMTGKWSFYVTRALIGGLEGGFIADLVLWLSYFYKSSELPLRLSFFWTSLSTCQILTSLLAFGILRMRGIHGLAGWRYLFIIEGLITLAIAVCAFFWMVPSAVQTKNRFRPNGWFTEREEKIVVNRVLRDDPSKGDMHNRQPLSLKQIWKSLCDYDLWPIYAVGFIAYIPMNTIQPYMTLAMKSLGFSTFNVNLLNIPQAFIHIIILIFITWLSERLNERTYVCFLLPLFNIPFLAAIRWWSGSMKQAWPTWFLVTMVLAAPYIHAICVSWVSRNSNSIRSRSVSSAVYNMAVQIGNIGATNIYRTDDKPLYHRGNTQLFIIAVALVPLLILVKIYYVQRNKQRDQIWDAMSPEQQEDYILNSTDEGNKRLDFRFDH